MTFKIGGSTFAFNDSRFDSSIEQFEIKDFSKSQFEQHFEDIQIELDDLKDTPIDFPSVTIDHDDSSRNFIFCFRKTILVYDSEQISTAHLFFQSLSLQNDKLDDNYPILCFCSNETKELFFSLINIAKEDFLVASESTQQNLIDNISRLNESI